MQKFTETMYLTKNIAQTIKDVDVKKGIVTGYFSKFGNIDSDGDVIQKGAYAKTISESFVRIKHLLDHDRTKAVGVIQILKEDDFGLYYESKAGRHTLGQDFLLMAEDGIISEHSVGIYPIKQMKGENDTNIITEVRMLEGSSLQTWGANEHTPMLGVKSEKDIINLLDELQKALTNGKYTDETFLEIEKKYKSLQITIAELFTIAEKKDILTQFLFK